MQRGDDLLSGVLMKEFSVIMVAKDRVRWDGGGALLLEPQGKLPGAPMPPDGFVDVAGL